jgi:AraC-like DNA-binding protein
MESTGELLADPFDLLARVSRSFLDDSLGSTRLISVAAGSYPEWMVGTFGAHLHVGVEVGIVLEGSVDRYYEDYQYRANAGDVWLVGLWEPHGWLPNQGASRVVLNFLPEFIGDETFGDLHWWALLSAPPSQRPMVSAPGLRARVLAIARELQPEIEQLGEDWQVAVRLSLLKLLFTLSRNWSPPSPRAREGASHLGRLLPALALLRDTAGSGPTLAAAAAVCGLQRSQFSVLFQRAMGSSFGRFRLRLRLAYAARLLISTENPVSAVAEQAGFSDSSHLHRAFVRQYGCTPATYRGRTN